MEKLSKLATRRLTVLRDFMKSLPRSASEHFEMGTWFKHGGEGHGHHGLDADRCITAKTLEGCGTSACAAGWGATIPSFRRAGFKWNVDEGFTIEPEDFFDISRYDDEHADVIACDLFYGGQRTPKEWAKECTNVLRKYGAK